MNYKEMMRPWKISMTDSLNNHIIIGKSSIDIGKKRDGIEETKIFLKGKWGGLRLFMGRHYNPHKLLQEQQLTENKKGVIWKTE